MPRYTVVAHKRVNLISSRKILSDFIAVISGEKFQRYIDERDLIEFLEFSVFNFGTQNLQPTD